MEARVTSDLIKSWVLVLGYYSLFLYHLIVRIIDLFRGFAFDNYQVTYISVLLSQLSSLETKHWKTLNNFKEILSTCFIIYVQNILNSFIFQNNIVNIMGAFLLLVFNKNKVQFSSVHFHAIQLLISISKMASV